MAISVVVWLLNVSQASIRIRWRCRLMSATNKAGGIGWRFALSPGCGLVGVWGRRRLCPTVGVVLQRRQEVVWWLWNASPGAMHIRRPIEIKQER